MLTAFMVTWGSDCMFVDTKFNTSKEAMDWLKGKKQRMSSDTDYVLFTSQFLCPISMDGHRKPLSEEEQIELMGNRSHRHPIWDKDDPEGKRRRLELRPVDPVGKAIAPADAKVYSCKDCGVGITQKQAVNSYEHLGHRACESCESKAA